MKRKHTPGAQVIGFWRSESDTEDSDRYGEGSGRSMIHRARQQQERVRPIGGADGSKPRDHRPVHICFGRGGKKLRTFAGTQFHAATALLHHLSAAAVQHAAAGALFVAHRAIRYACQRGRNGKEQQNDCDQAGETTHIEYSIAFRGCSSSRACARRAIAASFVFHGGLPYSE